MKGNGCLQCLLTTTGTLFETAKLITREKIGLLKSWRKTDFVHIS